MTKLPLWEQIVELDLNRKDKFFIGCNGSGKTTLLKSIANHFDNMHIKYISYDAFTALHEYKFYASVTDEETEIFLEFLEKITEAPMITNGKRAGLKNHGYLQEAMGAGHLRLLNMLVKAMRTEEPTFFLLDLPETSLWIENVRRLLEYIKSANPFVTCLVATHHPSMLVLDKGEIIDMNVLKGER